MITRGSRGGGAVTRGGDRRRRSRPRAAPTRRVGARASIGTVPRQRSRGGPTTGAAPPVAASVIYSAHSSPHSNTPHSAHSTPHPNTSLPTAPPALTLHSPPHRSVEPTTRPPRTPLLALPPMAPVTGGARQSSRTHTRMYVHERTLAVHVRARICALACVLVRMAWPRSISAGSEIAISAEIAPRAISR